MDWQIIVRLLKCIFSKPMKLDWDAVSSAPEIIVTEAIDISGVDSGLWKIVVAMKLAMNRERNDRASPVAISNVSPAMSKSCMSFCLFLALKFAMYFVMAEFTPQSRKRFIMSEGIKATEYNPYSAGDNSLARIIVPTAIIAVEAATPTNSWKLPVAEILPIFKAFSMGLGSFLFLVVEVLCCGIW